MGPSGTLHIPHGVSLHRSMSMGALRQDPNDANMGTLVAVHELRQDMDKLMQQQQRHPQNAPMLALEDLPRTQMTRLGPVIEPALQDPSQGQEMGRRELGIDPALQQQTQARVLDPRVGRGDGVTTIAGRMRAALSWAPSAAPENDEEEDDEEEEDEEEEDEEEEDEEEEDDGAPGATQQPNAKQKRTQKKPAARRPKATQDPPSQKKLAARRPLLKRPASHTAALPAKRQKRPATTTSTEAHPNLRFPGAGKQSPLHYKQSRVYTDVKNSRWRLYRRKGDKIETTFYWNHYSSPEECWAVMVAELRSINP